MWVAASELPTSPGQPFYLRLNTVLDAERFEAFVERRCPRFYAPVPGSRSGYALQRDQERSREGGFDGHMAK
jgi:transposase